MEEAGRQAVGLLVQGAVFLFGLCISLIVGMFLGAHTDGAGDLLIVTILTGAGLLGAAVVSQIVYDRIVYGG
jgi:hypothetical protein